jgi:hypothetical protein
MPRPLARPAFGLVRRQQLAAAPRYAVAAAAAPWRRGLYTTTSGKKSDPLRILFCGSDTVSTEALHALHEEWTWNRDLVQHLEVVVLPPKNTGRGYKTKTIGESSQLRVLTVEDACVADGVVVLL